MQKYPNILSPIVRNSLKSILILLFCIKFNEIYVRSPDAQKNSLLRKWMHIAKAARAQEHTEYYEYIMVQNQF